MDCPNITYIIVFIISKSEFKNLNFLIFEIKNINVIKKLKIFIDNIAKGIKLAKYLRFLPLVKLQNKIY